MARETWLTTAQAAELEAISQRAARKNVNSDKWKTRIERGERGGGNAGKRYLVALSSLSTLAQKRWYDRYPETLPGAVEMDEMESMEPQVVTGPVNLAEVKALVGGKRFDDMMQDAEQKVRAVKEFLGAQGQSRKTDLAAEIADRYGISASTLYRWVSEYESGGTAALMRKLPTLGVGTVRRTVPENVEKLIHAEYLQLHKPKVAHVYRKAKRFCELNDIKPPSKATVYRVITELEETKPDLVCLAREGEEEYIKRFSAKIARKDPEFVNQVWEGDHHKLDVFIAYQGRAVRPWITAWEDIASRTITGWTLAIQANGRTIGLALRHGILEKPMPVWDRPVSKAMSKALGSLGWDDDILTRFNNVVSPINGMPATLYIDNGEDYKAKVKKGIKHEGWEYSQAVRSSCEILQIDPMFCTKYSPWAKGHIERFFGTFTDQLARYLPGSCGNDNGKNRPYGLDEQAMAARDELLDIEELYFLTEIYFYFYHNTVHSSLGMTPLQKYEMTPKVREGIPDERTMDVVLMDVEKAKVYTTGIQRFGSQGNRRHYTHPALDKYIGRWVIIRYDSNRIGELMVFEAKTGQYICTATNRELMGWDASKDDISEVIRNRRNRKKEIKENLRGLKDYSLETTINKRKAAGPAMISGDTRQPQNGTRYITGLEKAAKASEKGRGPEPNDAAASNKRPKTSRFDEMIIKAGQM